MDDEKVSKRQRLICALLKSTTLEEAARESGVSPRTARRWRSDAAFQADFRTERRLCFDHAIARLQAGAVAAIEVLMAAMQNGGPAEKLKAADVLLKHALKGTEMADLAQQLRLLQDEIDVLRAPQQPGGWPRPAANFNGG